mgnify:CR=1 FL=1
MPPNVGQGYILRRLIRRAVRHGMKLGLSGEFLTKPADVVVELYKDAYPILQEKKDVIMNGLTQEEGKFLKTLSKGEHEFEKVLPEITQNGNTVISGDVAFRLYDTYGFPLEITEELARENGLQVDRDGFDKAFKKHQEQSKMDSSAVFKGGLADNTEETTKLHTATHLLHKALRIVLGEHVEQKGSNITQDRLSFDFSHPEKMTPEEISRVEKIVNEQIQKDIPVSYTTMTLGEAREAGAMALFGEKYGDEARVLSLGGFSTELCGGIHVQRTGDIGVFKIISEGGVASGIRRIEAVTGENALQHIGETEQQLSRAAELLRASRGDLADKVQQVLDRARALEKELEAIKARLASQAGSSLSDQAVEINGVKVLAARLDGADPKSLRDTVDQLKNKLGEAVIVLATVQDDKVSLVAGVTKGHVGSIKAGELVNQVAQQVGGRGGGRPDMAMAGGTRPEGLDQALASVTEWVQARL